MIFELLAHSARFRCWHAIPVLVIVQDADQQTQPVFRLFLDRYSLFTEYTSGTGVEACPVELSS